ncbi:prephenate dehydratase [Robertmurraya yapensis]|uniref:Prephenate dehydratase n=1 Tax=Bacillus yapensis TaxID=2492960 RepID=A0A3S0IHB2_9BACI|nr:prephenate dehydratase [Bacillus yapensis]RTR35447.1 prephenate dehydratase [Bacillus yapensis]TKS97956.1 prephenate dehydratase [Bacillus yapensis]
MKIAFLGPNATFTDIAVRELFPNDEGIPYITIPDCLDAVIKDEVDACVVPLENALEGSVNITLDYLIHEMKLPILAEVTAPIRQHLMVHPNHQDDWREIEVIYSHSHAIAQCHKFLHNQCKGMKRISVTSTAAAAKYVLEHPEIKAAAIANELAAQEYGLTIAKADIHDFDFNHTRFIVLAKQPLEMVDQKLQVAGNKTTLMITLSEDDRSGALHQVLSAFAWRKLNLSKIESRPTKTGLGNYFFIIDIEMSMDDVLIPGAIAELEALGCTVEVLGSYPYYHLNKN